MKETLWDYSLFTVCFVHLLDTFKSKFLATFSFPECCESIKLDMLLSHQLPKSSNSKVHCMWCVLLDKGVAIVAFCSSKDGCIDSCCQKTCWGCTRRARLECGPVRRPVLPLSGKSNPFNSKCSLHLKVSDRPIWAWWWWQPWHLKANSLYK